MRKRWIVGVIVFGQSLLIAQASLAERSIEYISQERVVQLESIFNSSAPIDLQHTQNLNQSSWICSLIGTNTRMQKIDGAQLYNFSTLNGELKNRGAQEIKSYSVKKGELVGRNHRVEDIIRQREDGRLIAKIKTIKDPQAVVAYANCSRI